MAWGFFKKVKDAFKKAGQFIKNKVIKPGAELVKKALPKLIKAAPAIGTAIGGAKGNPQLGAQIGQMVSNVGASLA